MVLEGRSVPSNSFPRPNLTPGPHDVGHEGGRYRLAIVCDSPCSGPIGLAREQSGAPTEASRRGRGIPPCL